MTPRTQFEGFYFPDAAARFLALRWYSGQQTPVGQKNSM